MKNIYHRAFGFGASWACGIVLDFRAAEGAALFRPTGPGWIGFGTVQLFEFFRQLGWLLRVGAIWVNNFPCTELQLASQCKLVGQASAQFFGLKYMFGVDQNDN
ncbi:MAG: hypothetical protein PVF82_05015 [Gammaproteobacteria bacterium]